MYQMFHYSIPSNLKKTINAEKYLYYKKLSNHTKTKPINHHSMHQELNY